MNKSKISIQAVGKYLRELSIVVVGVIITFGISFWVYNNNNKNDLKQYLNTIKMELEINVEILDKTAKELQKSVGYADYVQSHRHNKKLLNPDTINSYCNGGWGIFLSFTYTSTAFEMFKSSGAMRLMNDKELLVSIWEAYRSLDGLKLSTEKCYQIKLDESNKEDELRMEGKPVAVPMYNFYNSSLPYEMLQNCEKVSRDLREITDKLEKKTE